MTAPINDLFPAVSKADWIAQVNKDLKDTQAYDSLRWSLPEGFTMEPFYTIEATEDLPITAVQAAQKASPGWLNAPSYTITDLKNDAHRVALANGADALLLNLSALENQSVSALSRLVNGIKLSETPIFFRANGSAADFVRVLQTVAPYQLKGGLLSAPDETTAEATRLTSDSPQFKTVCVSGHDFHQAGATATQELAFVLARLTDTVDQLTEQGLTAEQVATKTLLTVSIGTSYFVEIAKLRALRVMLTRFIAAYRITADYVPVTIHAQTSAFYESTATPYTNLLRATTEAMAAVIGGCDLLTVRPYDAVFGQPSDFSQRVARNVSLLLKEESYIGKVADPAAGSYYIETLTHQLVQSAWALFLRVEEMGGLAKASDFVQAELNRSYDAKVEAVRNGKVLVGVTKFRFDEGAANTAQPPNSAVNPRLAQEFE